MGCQNVSLRKSLQNGQAIHRDRGRITASEQTRLALEIALYLHNFGNTSTFAWLAAGCPDNEATAADVDLFQTARNIVHSNSGAIRAGDSELVLQHVIQRHRLSREGANE